jgi:hypothetical protein
MVLSQFSKPPFTSMMENWEGGFVLDSFLVGWIWISFRKIFLSVDEF